MRNRTTKKMIKIKKELKNKKEEKKTLFQMTPSL